MSCAVVFGLGTVLSAHAVASNSGTLVVKAADDAYQPGAAASWSGGGDEVCFELAEGIDGEQAKATLSERLANVEITWADGKLTIRGIPKAALLDQLSFIDLSGEMADPLAALAGLGGASVATGSPEGGGSIRASKPMGGMSGACGDAEARSDIAEHDPTERVTAVVLSVTRGSFPKATLKLRVRGSAQTGPLKSALKRGKVFEAPVAFATQGDAVDFDAAANQRNIGAYYLEKGDKISAHAVSDGADGLRVDFVERIK